MLCKRHLLALLPFFLIACHNSTNSNSTPPFGQVIGDSVAFGIGSTAPSHNLTSCLEGLTGEPFANSAIPGTTTRHWLGEKIGGVTSQHPKLVFISLGGNDLMADLNGKLQASNPFVNSFPEEETLSNMAKILSALKDSDVIFLGINPPRTLRRPQTLFIDYRMARLENEVAPAAGVLVIHDAFDGMWLDSRYMHDDIHPNDQGYKLLCERIRKAMASDPRFKSYLKNGN